MLSRNFLYSPWRDKYTTHDSVHLKSESSAKHDWVLQLGISVKHVTQGCNTAAPHMQARWDQTSHLRVQEELAEKLEIW